MMADYREICFEQHDRECWNCGQTEELEVHHVDGYPGNNDPDNLLPLCEGCHDKVHNASDELETLSVKLGSRDRSIVPARVDIEPVYDLSDDVNAAISCQTLQRYSGGVSVPLPPDLAEGFRLKPKDEVVVQSDVGAPNEIRIYLPTARSGDGFPEEEGGPVEEGVHGATTRRIQSNGEITLPQDLREDLGLRHGKQVVVSEGDDGSVLITPIQSEGQS